MTTAMRWQPCVNHRPDEIDGFVAQYFPSVHGKILLIAGAGFDPRARSVPELLRTHSKRLPDGVFVKEERPNPDPVLVTRANSNLESLIACVDTPRLFETDVFASDGAVVGGRTVLRELGAIDLRLYSDVVIDSSALSIGISFPLVKYVLEQGVATGQNVHLFVSDVPALDRAIQPQLADRATNIHGFRKVNEYYSAAAGAKLWLPQLAPSCGPALQRIFDEVQPSDTCPILPFPSGHPKLSDQLLAEYLPELENTWGVDAGSLIFADENDPLGLYRTILRIDDERALAFEALGSSLLILSPLGSKMLAVGALMAALERNLPVYYVEARGYDVDWANAPEIDVRGPSIRHVWLAGC
ncbi:MAG: hypothetical protein C5B51_03015 [Terriglobia bacterium]|nr:MAG: hypothetical protein C5B51_03015 [Terriglobia bacterium]